MNFVKKNYPLFIFFLICFLYLFDSFFNIYLDSKRNIAFIIILFLIIFAYLYFKKFRVFILISAITILAFDTSFNLFFQDNFPNIKIKPLIKNSVQKSGLYINDWPYFKFKPNIIAKSYGDRGEDCLYEWKTDNLGFKNIEIKKNYEFIFLGNSYVEGLCAAIDETASYYLTKKNIPTYNLGVQGWSDKQAIKALRIINENKINFNGVIFGYLSNRFLREKNLLDLDKPVQGGGLGRVMEVELRGGKSFFVTREILQNIFMLDQNKFNWSREFSQVNLESFLKEKKVKLRDKYKDTEIPQYYIPPIIRRLEMANINFENNELIKISNKSILDLAKKLQFENKKFIIFHFAFRPDVFGHIIYEDGYICNTDYYEAVKIINENLKGVDYIYLDIFDEAVKLTEKWIENRDYSNFIWKYKDGHYSKLGNKLVADTIENYLNDGKMPTKEYLKFCN